MRVPLNGSLGFENLGLPVLVVLGSIPGGRTVDGQNPALPIIKNIP